MTTLDRFCGIHAALRKGSDTDWSVLLWNLLNCTDSDVWLKIVTHAAEVYPTLSAAPAMKLRTALTTKADHESQTEVFRCQSTHDGIAIMKAFELCDDETLVDIVRFIGLDEAEAVTVEVQV